MTTFLEFSERHGSGVTYLLDVKNRAGTTLYRFATVTFRDGSGNLYDGRVMSLGNVENSFGVGGAVSSPSLTVQVDNTDGALDVLANASEVSAGNIYGLTWLLTACLYDPSNPADFAFQNIGVFQLFDPPTRRSAVIEFSLVGRSFGDAMRLKRTPSLRDWTALGAGDPNRPFDSYDDTPIQLAFGSSTPMKYIGKGAYVICAVAGAPGVLPTTSLKISAEGSGSFIPSTVFSQPFGSGAGATLTTWTCRRTPTIAVDGTNFHLLWVQMDLYQEALTFGTTLLVQQDAAIASGAVALMVEQNAADPEAIRAAYLSDDDEAVYKALGTLNASGTGYYGEGFLFSHPANDLAGKPIHLATILEDILTSYVVTPPGIDGGSFTRVKKARPLSYGGGTIQLTKPAFGLSAGFVNTFLNDPGDNSALAAVKSICAGMQADLYFNGVGLAVLTAAVNDSTFQLASFLNLDETLVADVSERIPGFGERNAPYNRLVFKGPQGSTLTGSSDITYNDNTAQATWGRVVTREVDGSWMLVTVLQALLGDASLVGGLGFGAAGWGQGLLDTRVRSTVTLKTGLNGLNYALGDYLTFTWSRGGLGGPFTNAVFRVEAISLAPESSATELVLMSAADFKTSGLLPYILDDEVLSRRSLGSGGRTATLTTGSTIVSFSSGNFFTDGVVAGDQFIVTDASESGLTFDRNRVIDIVAVGGATSITLGVSDFGAGGPFVLSTWEIRRSRSTYRGGATIYGKVANNLCQDGAAAISYRLLEG